MASATKLLSIPIPASQLKLIDRLAKQSGLTVEEWALQSLNQAEVRERRKQELSAALAATREDARRKGTHKLTMREINEEIAIVRRELQAKKSRRVG